MLGVHGTRRLDEPAAAVHLFPWAQVFNLFAQAGALVSQSAPKVQQLGRDVRQLVKVPGRFALGPGVIVAVRVHRWRQHVLVGASAKLHDGEAVHGRFGVLLGPADFEQRQIQRHTGKHRLVAVGLAVDAHAAIHHFVVVNAKLLKNKPRPGFVVDVQRARARRLVHQAHVLQALRQFSNDLVGGVHQLDGRVPARVVGPFGAHGHHHQIPAVLDVGQGVFDLRALLGRELNNCGIFFGL